MKKKGIIFDLDGTLWDASEQVVPALNAVLRRYPELNKEMNLKEMNGYFGKQIDKIEDLPEAVHSIMGE